MKALLEKIRRILRDRRTRKFLTRFVSGVAAVVVFVTTYALVLPAITMESEAYCGVEAHQHDDSCYTENLICGQEESEGHHHTEDCYTVTRNLACPIGEHRHTAENGCFAEDGSLICTLEEHAHEDSCCEEVRELTCGLEETEGHHHTDDCYEKVLTCGKEVHIHSAECYRDDEEIQSAAVASTGVTSAAAEIEDDNAHAGSIMSQADEISEVSDSFSSGSDKTGPDDKSASGNTFEDFIYAGDTDTNITDADDAADTSDKNTDNHKDTEMEEEEDASSYSTGFAADEYAENGDIYIPDKDALDFYTVLNGKTGIYYYHVDEDEELEDSSAITDWTRVDEDTELNPQDIIRVYLSYTLPKDTINATNDISRYRLPDTLHLTEDQIEAINSCENGISSRYIDYDNLEITDPQRHTAYLGLESVEGRRSPGEEPDEDSPEYITAVVRAEKIYDEGTGEYEGTDLIFTFSPYAVEKNANAYDKKGQPTRAGEEVTGWLTLDFNMGQIDWAEDNSSEVVFAQEDEENDISEISTVLSQADPADAETDESNVDGATEEAAEYATEEAAAAATTSEIAAEDSNEAAAAETAVAAATGSETAAESNSEKTGPDAKKDSENAQDNKVDIKEKSEAANYPAAVFDDSITVRSGRLDTDLDDTDLPRKSKMTVHVEADEGTFPDGTKMVLSAVEDLNAVAEAVGSAVDSKTRGFQAVDITFYDKDPSAEDAKEIQPLKPIRVSIKSDEIRKAAEDSSTAPVVVHIEDNKKASETESVDSVKSDIPAASIVETEMKSTDTDGTANTNVTTDTDKSGDTDKSADNGSESADRADAAGANDTVVFEAASFSVYAIVYTVDFHWEVDGKTFEFSIPGGGFITLQQLVEVLGIANTDTYSENTSDDTENIGNFSGRDDKYSTAEVPDADDADAYEESDSSKDAGKEQSIDNSGAHAKTADKEIISLNNVIISEATKNFVADVESVEFSNPALEWVGKVGESTTVGKIKETNGLESQYSAELSEEQIEEINSSSVEAGDWALISVQPFESEESLTVTMSNGDRFVIWVTDAQISADVLTAKGETYRITVTYDEDAEIPEGAKLVAEEIRPAADEYIQHVAETLGEVNRVYFEQQEQLKKGVDPDSLALVQPVSIDQARFFHVEIMYQGRKIEPKTPVQVDIKYVDGLGIEGIDERIPGVSHFTNNTVEVISEVTTRTDEKGRIVEFGYTQDSFSDIGTFIGHEGHDRRMKASAPNVNLRNDGTGERPTVADFIAENGAPESSKALNDNGDGTYTLTLNVKPQSSEYTISKKSNVLFIMDRSSSMDRNSDDSYLEYESEADAVAALSNNQNVYGNIGGVYTPLSYLVNDYGNFWTSASGIYDTSNGLYYGVSGSRFSQEQAALGNLINQLMTKNQGTGNEENIEISVISFATYAGNEQKYSYVGGTSSSNWGGSSSHQNDPAYRWGGTEIDWTGGTDATQLINGVNELDMARGTNWEEALRYAKDVMDAKKQADGLNEDYYVVFLTDGAPTATSWSITQHDPELEWGAYYGNGTTHSNGEQTYQNNEGIPLAYEPARDDALALVAEGYKLYNIFTYGEGTDYNYLVRLTNYAYSEGRNDSTTVTEPVEKYFKNATNTAELVEYFKKIFEDITTNGIIGHSQVKIRDGLTQGAMTSSFVNGKPSAVRYTVTPGAGSTKLPYTVQVTMPEEGTDPIVTFTINGHEYSTTSSGSGRVEKKENPAGAYDAGEYYCVTVDGVEYRMALATVTDGGELTWDLTPMGVLWDDSDYKAKFVVWPKQEAYNYVAGLNNNMPDFEWDQETANEHEHIDSQGRKYWSHGVDGLESIVKYEDGTFAVLTNTHQEMEYSVAQVENDQLVDSATPTEEPLSWPDPMPLNATKTNLEKQWNVDRNPAILAQYLYNPDGSSTEFVAKFNLFSDNSTTAFATVSLGWDSDLGQYVWDESSVRRVVYAGHVFYIGTRWSDEINIATGLMLTVDRLQALGLNPNDYPKAQYGDTIYYILERGHDYHVKESTEDEGTDGEGTDGESTAKKGLGYEFDFESPVFHPMLVNGQMVNIVFEDEMNEETLSLTEPYPIEKMVPAPMNSIGSLVVDNTLRGYINVEKIVLDKDGKTKLPDDTTKFSYDVVLDNTVLDPAPFTVDDSNVPWYGINGLFYHEIIGGEYRYYEAAPLGGNRLSLLTESGETVIAETEGDPFDKDTKGPTRIRIVLNEEEEQYGEWFDLYGNEMVHDSDSHVYDTIQIRQGQTLNIANVPKGTTYTITESILDPDYDLMSIAWRINDGDTTIKSGQVADISSASFSGEIVSNRDNRVIFTNKIHSADLKVKKVENVGGNDVTLLGAKFTLTKSIVEPETEAQTWTMPEPGKTDTGTYTFADLPDGVYTLTETPPPNYTGVDPITFVVANGVIYMPGDTLPDGVTMPSGAVLPGDVVWTNNNNKTFALTIPNEHIEPDDDEIRVEKRWVDQNGETAEGSRDVKVQLRRKKLNSHDVTVVFEAGTYQGNTPRFEEVFPSISGDEVTIEYSLLPNNGQWNNADITVSKSPQDVRITDPISLGNNRYRIVASGVESDVTITIFFNNKSWQLWNYYTNNIKSTVSVTGNGQGNGDYVPDDNFPASADLAKATKTLTAPDYYASWKFGEGNSYDFPADGYQYYIVELDENDQPLQAGQGNLVSIRNNDGITHGIITATNRINGSLTLKKQLGTLLDENVSLAAGKYNFTVTGPGEQGTTKYVQIRIDAAGSVTYKVSNQEISFDETEGFVDAPADGSVLIPDLPAGKYKVTEGTYQLDDQSGKYITSLGEIEVDSGKADLSTGSATLDVRAENTPSAAATFTNMLVPVIDVPVMKTWQWSENDEGKAESWTATFNLEYREVLVSGEEAPDAKHSWTPVYDTDGTTQKSVTLRSTDSVQEKFNDLPLYRIHDNGSVYRVIYAVDEVAYTINWNDGSPSTTWSKNESGHLSEHYSPDYEQDAGESEQPENQEDWDEWYTIRLKNVKSTREIEKTIDLSLEKVWKDEELQADPDSRATFQLKRTYHEEYLDYTKYNLDPNDLVTVKLVLGDGASKELVVPRNAPVYVSAVVKPGNTANLRFSKEDGEFSLSGPDTVSTSQEFIKISTPFPANADGDEMIVSYVRGDTSVLVGGLDGLGLASFDPDDTTEEQEDEAFNHPMSQDGQSAGQKFTLDAEHGWSKEWAGLPQVVEELSVTDSGIRMKTIVYSYYLEEIKDECYPKNYEVSFRNGQGDEHNPLISSTAVVAENRLETTELSGTKTWSLDEDISYVLGTPILKLSRRTETTTIDDSGNPITILSEPEDVTVSWEGEEQYLQPTWHSDGGFTRSFTYTNLPKKDKDGKTYVYSVEEVEFTVGAGENEVVYTASRQTDGTYIVTSNKEGAAPYAVTQNGNDITNTNMGGLQVTKTIRKNGNTDTSATGTFYYAVYAEQYNPDADPPQQPVSTGSITIETGDDGTKAADPISLPLGTYYVYELTGSGGTPIVSDNNTEHTIDGVIYAVDGSGTSVSLADTSIAAVPLINDIQIGYLKIHKEVTFAGHAPNNDAQKAALQGIYQFGIYKDRNCEIPAIDSEEFPSVTIGTDGQGQDSNVVSLPAGTYWIKEIIEEDGHMLPVGEYPKEVTIQSSMTSTSPFTFDVTNDFDYNENDDDKTVDIVKKFEGITDPGQLPEGYMAVLKYMVDGQQRTVDLTDASYTQDTGDRVHIKVTQTDDGLTWKWHIYGIPKNADNFTIHEENAEKTGYELEVTFNNETVNPEDETGLIVVAPTAVLNEITDLNRITPQSVINGFYVGDTYVILVAATPKKLGTIVISSRSLNYLEREAIETWIQNSSLPDDFNRSLIRFFSTEQHETEIVISDNKSLTVSKDSDGKHYVSIPPSVNSQVAAFDVTYDNMEAFNNGEIINKYTASALPLDIIKLDADSLDETDETKKKYLENAEFTIKQLDENGRGNYMLDPESTATPPELFYQETVTTNGNGKAGFPALKPGYYEIKETGAPQGYIINPEPFYIRIKDGVISRLRKTGDDTSTHDTDESLVVNWPVENDNSGMIRFKAAEEAVEDIAETTDVDESAEASNAAFTVGNTPGAALPYTGGPGTNLFYLIGCILMMLASAGIIMKKRHRTDAV